MTTSPGLERVLRRLETRVLLDAEDRAAVLALPLSYRTLEPAAYIVREGEAAEVCVILLTGFAYRHKVTGHGERQIMSVHMPGEFLDLQNCLLGIADHNVQTLTRCEIATVPVEALRELAEARPRVGRAMWIDTLIDSAIFREWIVNVGRRDSISRISHLLCELALRLEAADLARGRRYELPMTQEQIGDCIGLTPIHVNRMMKALEAENLITRQSTRSVMIGDWRKLAAVGDFDSNYLHMREDDDALA